METYRHFGLQKPPFEGPPDPAWFFAAPSHAEAFATLQFAVHGGKACTLVLGDSGSGKTLLGLLLAQSINAHRTIVWVHGIGLRDRQTVISIYPPGTVGPLDHRGPAKITRSTLADWLPTALAAAHPNVVIVDDADGLRRRAWEDLLTLVTQGIRGRAPLSVVLFGLSRVVDTLAQESFVRLQRRLFRTCQLGRFSGTDTLAYIRHRLRTAGAPEHDIFAPAAVNLIHRFSDGNPALINQLCDNSLVDAFGDDRARIEATHVMATVTAITGGIRRQLYLPSTAARPASDVLPAVPGRTPAMSPLGADLLSRTVLYGSLSERLLGLKSRLTAARARARDARLPPPPPRPVVATIEDPV